MKQLLKRLRAPSGETLVETLVSTLIIGLSVFLLVSMVISSLRMDRQAQEDDRQLYTELAAAEGGTSLSDGKMVLKRSSAADIELNVTIRGTKDGLTAYEKAQVTSP